MSNVVCENICFADSDGKSLPTDKRRKAHAHSSKKTKEKRHKKKKKYSRKQARSMGSPRDIKTRYYVT